MLVYFIIWIIAGAILYLVNCKWEEEIKQNKIADKVNSFFAYVWGFAGMFWVVKFLFFTR